MEEALGDKIFPQFVDPFTWLSFGDKGFGKSVLAYSLNKAQGRFGVLDFDGNTRQTLKANFPAKVHDNFKIWDIKRDLKTHTKGVSDTDLPQAARIVYEIVEDEYLAELDSFQPNFEIYDGYQRWHWIAEMSMRADQNIAPFGGVKNRNAWKKRNWNLDKIWNESTDRATDGILVTVHETTKRKEHNKQYRIQEDKKKAEQKDEKYDERAAEEEVDYIPTWSGNIKEEVWVLTRCYGELDVLGETTEFFANVKSNKLTGRVGANLDVTGKKGLQAYWNWLLDPPDKFLV
ncbi:MAG: hypothetical protein KJI71_01390 [Patescibacteria group bacterium]|nr:hypothetical protein [Patescibacteria group bacterium]